MCARVTLRSGLEGVREEFGVRAGREPHGFSPSYNISPGRDVLAVVRDGEARLALLRWGLLPLWAKDASVGNRLINARAEGIAQKPAFAEAFRRRRCLIVVDGFYEWRREGGRSVPFFVRMEGDGVFGLAGLYESWRAPEGCDLLTCAVITTEANTLISPIHSRMPVVIEPGDRGLWLDPEAKDLPALERLLRPREYGGMEAYRVSSLVNSAANDSPECVRPAGG